MTASTNYKADLEALKAECKAICWKTLDEFSKSRQDRDALIGVLKQACQSELKGLGQTAEQVYDEWYEARQRENRTMPA